MADVNPAQRKPAAEGDSFQTTGPPPTGSTSPAPERPPHSSTGAAAGLPTERLHVACGAPPPSSAAGAAVEGPTWVTGVAVARRRSPGPTRPPARWWLSVNSRTTPPDGCWFRTHARLGRNRVLACGLPIIAGIVTGLGGVLASGAALTGRGRLRGASFAIFRQASSLTRALSGAMGTTGRDDGLIDSGCRHVGAIGASAIGASAPLSTSAPSVVTTISISSATNAAATMPSADDASVDRHRVERLVTGAV